MMSQRQMTSSPPPPHTHTHTPSSLLIKVLSDCGTSQSIHGIRITSVGKQFSQSVWSYRDDSERFSTVQILSYKKPDNVSKTPKIAQVEIGMICEIAAGPETSGFRSNGKNNTNNSQSSEPKNKNPGQLLSLKTFPETNSVT